MVELKEIQDVAENRGEEIWVKGGVTCLHCILLAVQEALKEVDEIQYAESYLIKATNGLPGGIWAGTGPCGVVVAGAIAISLRYGTEDYMDSERIWETGMKARDWYLWFEKQFGSCDCIDLSVGTDFSNPQEVQEYVAGPRIHLCGVYVKQGVRKIIDELTKDNQLVKQ